MSNLETPDENVRDFEDELDDDLEADPKATIPAAAVQQPGIIAAVGSGPVGSVDVEPDTKDDLDIDEETAPE